MSTSRDWGDRPSFDPQFDRQYRRQLVRGVLIAGAVIAGAVAVVAASRMLRRDPLAKLRTARQNLRQALETEDPQQRLSSARAAEAAVRDYQRRGGRDLSTSHLLLAAALGLQDVADPHFPVGKQMELEELFDRIRPAEVPFADLYLAAKLIYQTGRPMQADWLLTSALTGNSAVADEERQQLLRVAIQVGYELGNEEEVLKRGWELAKLRPNDPYPWQMMTQVYEDQNYPEPLIESYGKLLELGGDNPTEIHRKLAERLLEVGRTADARKQIEWLEQNAPAALREHPILPAHLLLQEGEPQEALELANQILTENPEDAEAALLKSRILLAGQELDEVVTLLEALLARDPLENEAHYLLGQAYSRQGQRERAEHHFVRQRRLLDVKVELHRLERRAGADPHNAQVRRDIAELYKELGMAELASQWFHAANAIHPQE